MYTIQECDAYLHLDLSSPLQTLMLIVFKVFNFIAMGVRVCRQQKEQGEPNIQ